MDAVVSVVPVRRSCRGPGTVIDRFDLWRNGAHALWIERDGIRVESVNGWRGERPWVVRPRARGNEKPREAFPELDPISEDDGG